MRGSESSTTVTWLELDRNQVGADVVSPAIPYRLLASGSTSGTFRFRCVTSGRVFKLVGLCDFDPVSLEKWAGTTGQGPWSGRSINGVVDRSRIGARVPERRLVGEPPTGTTV